MKEKFDFSHACAFKQFVLFVVILGFSPKWLNSSTLNDHVLDKFAADKNGKILLLHQGNLYNKLNFRADSWGRIVTDIKDFKADPQNSNIIYIVKKNNIVQKSLDSGGKWLTITNGIPQTEIISLFINSNDDQKIYVCSKNECFCDNKWWF